jgi:hypothetical protein
MVNKEENGKDDNAVNCEHVLREISNYIDGEVDPALRSAMDAHFKTCPRCASVLVGTRNVVHLYSDERMVDEMIEVPVGYSGRLQQRLAQNARGSRSRWSSLSLLSSSSLSPWLVPVAAVALIAGGLWLATGRAHTPAQTVQQHQPQQKLPPNNIPPELVVVVSTDTDSKLFHVAGCLLIHDQNKVRTLTAKEASEEGYTPCSQCLRKYLTVAGNHGAAADDDRDNDHDEEADSGVRSDGR